MRIAAPLTLSTEDLAAQACRQRGGSTASDGTRQIILQAVAGQTNEQIAQALGVTRQKVARRRERFLQSGRAWRRMRQGAVVNRLMVPRCKRSLSNALCSRTRPKRRNGARLLKFLQLIEGQTPADRDLHLILDNYATHKHPKCRVVGETSAVPSALYADQRLLAEHVERFFRELTVNRLRRGVFHSVPELVPALEQYIAQHNKEPKPFIWTAKGTDILAKVTRARKKLTQKLTSR